jgi:hypothetical protein
MDAERTAKSLLKVTMNSEFPMWRIAHSAEVTFMKTRSTTMTKKISKVIIYYEDGTYEEVKAGLPDTQGQQDKKVVSPNPVMPDFRPDTQKVQEWPTVRPTFVPPHDTWPFPTWQPNTIWCGNTDDNVKLNYTINPDSGSWTFTSTGNSDNLNKYTITSTGNGNVDLSK